MEPFARSCIESPVTLSVSAASFTENKNGALDAIWFPNVHTIHRLRNLAMLGIHLRSLTYSFLETLSGAWASHLLITSITCCSLSGNSCRATVLKTMLAIFKSPKRRFFLWPNHEYCEANGSVIIFLIINLVQSLALRPPIRNKDWICKEKRKIFLIKPKNTSLGHDHRSRKWLLKHVCMIEAEINLAIVS